ncbi:MAG: tetratricopeptide repeat protein [Acidobacteriota bacterium]
MTHASFRFVAVLLVALSSSASIQADPGNHTSEEARAMLARGEYGQAEERARAELTALEGGERSESLAAAEYLDVIVAASVKLGKERSADVRALAERALAIRTRLQGGEHPDTAASMVGLADVLRRHREFAAAQPLYEQALAVREKTFGAESAEMAESLNGIANLLFDSGSFDMALPLYRQALAIRERLFGLDHASTADALNNIGTTLRQLGDLRGARENLERALAVYETLFGPQHMRVASALNSLALVLKQSGDWNGARTCMRRALPIYQKQLGDAHPYVAGLLNNLANLERTLGDLDAARALFERSLAIREKTLGTEHPEVAQSLNNIGTLLAEQGRPEQARSLLERSLAIREKRFGPNHLDVALTVTNHGGVLGALGELAAAEQAHLRAHAIRSKELGDSHPLVAESLHNLALVHLAAGDFAAARGEADRAVSIWTAVYGETHPIVAQGLLTLARVQRAQGESAGAFATALRSEEVARRHLVALASQLSEAESLRYAAIRVSGRNLLLGLLGRTATTPEERRRAWESVARSRGLVLDALIERRRTVVGLDDPTLRALQTELASATSILASALGAVPDLGASDSSLERIEALHRRRDDAERALAGYHPAAGARLSRDRLTLEQVAALLPPGSALLSFVRVVDEPSAEGRVTLGSLRSTLLPALYLAFVLPAGAGEVTVVFLGGAPGIEAKINAWSAEAARGALQAGRSPRESLAAYRKAGRELRHALWDPLVPALEGTHLVFVVPDGALNLVNWAALPTGATSYLLESGPLFHRLTAERELLFAADGASGRALLAIGGPAFGDPAMSAAGANGAPAAVGRGHRFPPLPGAALEVEEIAAIWRGSVDAPKVGSATLLTRERATETAFKELAPHSTVLHIATHGFFPDGATGVGPGSTRGMGGLAPSSGVPTGIAVMEGPVGAAGLAFAGANVTATGKSSDDGILTAEEVAVLDLGRAEWAVLSACDTGIGALHASEGVLGLQRAFRAAGARAVVMSLWAVDDQASRLWMGALYRARLERRMTTAEAVRAAALEVLRQRRARGFSHPFAWGGFVATGDWR